MTDAELDQYRHDGALLRSIVADQVKLKREGREWKGLCPFHNETIPSFTVYEDGHFHCFGCSAHGTSFDYVMKRDGVEFPEAAKRVAAEMGAAPSRTKPKPQANGNGTHTGTIWQPIIPPPADAPPPTADQLHCDRLHEYRDADDRVLCYVRRVEATNGKGKRFYPLSFGVLDGKTGWHAKAPDKPKPLYGLNRLAHAPDAVVLLCEGEKSADAAQRLFPHYVAMSWMGGVNGDGVANLAPLTGRKVTIWGDADAVGRSAVARLAKRLPHARVLDTEGLSDGFDAADLERQVDDPDEWLDARVSQQATVKSDEPECTLSDLKNAVFEPLRWIVPDYIPEGLTVLGGRPKIGKSWFILGVGLGVARGSEALGRFVQRGDVLYCGLEDGKRRMRSRVEKMLGPAIKEWPANFTFRYRLDPLDAGGLDTIETWLIEHPNRRLVVIDTLGRVRGMKQPREEQYQYDYRLLGALQDLATRYSVAIVVVHHVRKTDAEDVLDTISGTTGIAGAADTVMVLGRTDRGVRMYLRGRDAEEQDKLLEFDPETALWEVTGDFDETNPGGGLLGLRKRVAELLDGSPVALTPVQIAERLNEPNQKVRLTLYRMVHADPPQIAKGEQQAGGGYSYVSLLCARAQGR
jgi:hypothetical protein